MRRVLLVDDDPRFLQETRERLQSHGEDWQVTTARNGIEALQRAGQQAFDLLITDIFMPEKDGYETIIAFRKEFPSTQIIAVSGGAGMDAMEPLQTARLLGAGATLTKPLDFPVLLDRIGSLCGPESDGSSSAAERGG